MPGTPRLLIVDDKPDNLFVLTQVVHTLVPGCEVVTAADAEHGLALVAVQEFDGAVIDVQMPGMDGIEMCQRLKQDPSTSRVPVILITSHGASAEFKAQGLDAPAPTTSSPGRSTTRSSRPGSGCCSGSRPPMTRSSTSTLISKTLSRSTPPS